LLINIKFIYFTFQGEIYSELSES